MSHSVLLLFAVLLGTMAMRVPVIVCVVLATVVYGLVYTIMPPVVLAQNLVGGLEKPVFAAIPYYFLLGSIMEAGGISARLVRLASALLGGLRGGLAHANIGTSILFGGISGSAVADATAVGSIMIPAMKKEGYPGAYAAAVTASSATIGLLIPPSIPLVMYGLFNSVSVRDLFLAGIVPGLLMGLYLLAASYLIARRREYKVQPWSGIDEILAASRYSLLALLLPVVTTACIVQGVATVSEVGAVAVAYAAFVSVFVYKTLSVRELWQCLVTAAINSAKILSIIAVSGGFLWIIANLGVMNDIESNLSVLRVSPTILLALIASGIVLTGTLVSPMLQMILIIPALTPVAASFGIDLVHFGVVVVLASAIGMVTPPVGLLLFLTASQANCSVMAVVWESLPFLFALLVLLVCLVVFPALSIGLLSLIA